MILFGVYSASLIQTDSNSLITLVNESIHQAPLLGFGVYFHYRYKTNNNCSVTYQQASIHQTSIKNIGVYYSDGNQSGRKNVPVISLTGTR